MRNIFLMAPLLFLSFSQVTRATGIQIEVGGTFLSNTEIETIGTNTITGSNLTLNPPNKISYTSSLAFVLDTSDRFSLVVALGYMDYKTDTVTTASSTDNSSYNFSIFDLRFMGQIDITNSISLRVGAVYPVKVIAKGAFDSTAGQDEFTLDGKIGLTTFLGYNFTRKTSLRLGYLLNFAEKINAKAGLDIKITSHQIALAFAYEI